MVQRQMTSWLFKEMPGNSAVWGIFSWHHTVSMPVMWEANTKAFFFIPKLAHICRFFLNKEQQKAEQRPATVLQLLLLSLLQSMRCFIAAWVETNGISCCLSPCLSQCRLSPYFLSGEAFILGCGPTHTYHLQLRIFKGRREQRCQQKWKPIILQMNFLSEFLGMHEADIRRNRSCCAGLME